VLNSGAQGATCGVASVEFSSRQRSGKVSNQNFASFSTIAQHIILLVMSCIVEIIRVFWNFGGHQRGPTLLPPGQAPFFVAPDPQITYLFGVIR
jgi:hypothetical protein